MYNKDNPLRVVELFAGYGSQRLALKRLKEIFPDFCYKVVAIAEIEPNALNAYTLMHGDCPNLGDVTEINWGGNISDFDLLTYSFPCQSISAAGLQHGFAEGSGTRSSLLWECKRAIIHKHPKWLLMENVKALTQKKFMPDFQKWIDWLASQGYVSYWQVLNAKNYGIPQNRERVFMVSIRDDGDNPMYHFPQPFALTKRLKDVLEDNVADNYYLKPQQVDRIIAHCERKVAEGCGFKTNFTSPDGISGAIKTKEGQREYDTYVKELPPRWI
jgi:DNA (cytosine-5)-methyltransferase 1